jgi:hypothetical protein
MASTSSFSSSPIGIGSLLTVAFVILKLLITGSWWWVLAPTWIPVTIVLVIFVVAVIWAVRQ